MMKFDQICVCPCDITKISDIGKQNSTLGSVVPLAMLLSYSLETPSVGWFVGHRLVRVYMLLGIDAPAC